MIFVKLVSQSYTFILLGLFLKFYFRSSKY